MEGGTSQQREGCWKKRHVVDPANEYRDEQMKQSQARLELATKRDLVPGIVKLE